MKMPTQAHNTSVSRTTVITLALLLGMSATPSQAASLTVSIDDTAEGIPFSTYGGSGWNLVSSVFDPENPNRGFTDNLVLPDSSITLPQGVTSVTAHANLIEQPPGEAGGQIGSGRFSDQVSMMLSNSAGGIVLNLTFITDTNEDGQTTAIGLQETGSPQILLNTISGETQVNFFTGPTGVGFNFGTLEFKVTVSSDLDPVPEPSSLLLLGSGAIGLLMRLRARMPK